MRQLLVAAGIAGAVIAIALGGCDKEPPAPKYVQAEYAKDPDGDCEARPSELYAEKAKTPAGIEDLIFMACHFNVRGDYHSAKAKALQEPPGDPNTHLAKALRCTREAITAAEALQQVGVTKFRC